MSELVANIPYKTWESRKTENPSEVVEKIKIVCMGHEPDLKASLEQELSAYNVEIEVLDILKEKANLQFKREAEAVIERINNKVYHSIYDSPIDNG